MAASDKVSTAVKSLLQNCSAILKGAKDDEGRDLLIHCQHRCEKLLSNAVAFSVETLLQEYAQALLDFTYFEEQKLVDEGFPEDTSHHRVKKLLYYLNHPVELAQELLMEKQIFECLSPEIHECILWRKGALLYMFCSSVYNELQRRGHKDEFLQNLLEGISYLQEMLKVRKPLREAEDEIFFNDEDTYNLLKQGIYTDTHVLALMYGGEMCYWYLTASTDHPSIQDSFHLSLDPISVGKNMLTTYLKLTQGPLKTNGWDYAKAEELRNTPYFSNATK